MNIPPGNPVLPPTLIASPTLTLYGKAWHSYWVERRDTSVPGSSWVFAARVPLTSSFQAFAPAPPPNTAFRVFEFVADPPILELWPQPGQQVQLVLYGAPAKTFELQTTNTLPKLPTTWSFYETTGTMTNSFRIFPPFTPSNPRLFYRAKEL